MADEKDTDSTSESGAAARSDEPEDVDPVAADAEDAEDVDDADPDDADPDDADSAEEADSEESGSDEADRDSESAEDDSADTDSDRELVGVGAGSTAAAATSGTARSDRGSHKPKGRPTPRRKNKTEEPTRTTPISFIRGSIGELKQVVYPTGSQLMNYFIVVLVFVLFIIAIVTAMDAGFGWIMLRVFG